MLYSQPWLTHGGLPPPCVCDDGDDGAAAGPCGLLSTWASGAGSLVVC